MNGVTASDRGYRLRITHMPRRDVSHFEETASKTAACVCKRDADVVRNVYKNAWKHSYITFQAFLYWLNMKSQIEIYTIWDLISN